MSKTSKGAYYEKKTREWLEKTKGAWVSDTKYLKGIRPMGNFSIPIKGDIWGADLMWRTEEEFGFVQVKSNRAHVSEGRKALSRGPWPDFIKLWVVWWKPRSRNPDPVIYDVSEEKRCLSGL